MPVRNPFPIQTALAWTGALLAAPALWSAARPASITILDWNIDRGSAFEAIVETIRAQHADIAILQEVDWGAARSGRKDVARELASRLQLQYAFGRAFQELNQGDADHPAYQGQATLSRYEILSQRVIEFVHQTEFWKPQPYLPRWFPQRRLGGRVGLVATVATAPRPLAIYNLHLESRGPGYNRYQQLKETLADAAQYPPDAPVVVAGDLNTKYAPGRFVKLLADAGFHDCFAGRRTRTHRVIGDLDWIFVRGPIGCEDAHVVRDARGSDHFPVVTHLSFR